MHSDTREEETADGFDRRKFLGLSALAAGAALTMGLPRRVEAHHNAPFDNPLGPINVKNHGAKGDGITNDTESIQAAIAKGLVDTAKYHRMATIYFPPGTYVIGDSDRVYCIGGKWDADRVACIGGKVREDIALYVDMDFDAQKPEDGNFFVLPLSEHNAPLPSNDIPKNRHAGIRFLGDNATLFLKSEGHLAFFLKSTSRPYPHTSFSFENLKFVAVTRTRIPQGIYAEGVNNISVKDCVFYGVGLSININGCSDARVINCSFEGCETGVQFNMCRDALISGCYAHACTDGFKLEGVASPNSDGGMRITHCVALQCHSTGFSVNGAYTPQLTNLVVEGCGTNILIRNSDMGILSNVFCGHAHDRQHGRSLVITRGDGMDTRNTWWNLTDIFVQDQILLEYIQQASIKGLIFGPLAGGTAGRRAILLQHSSMIDIHAVVAGDLADYEYALEIGAGCHSVTLNGGRYHRKVLFASAREVAGGNFLNGPVLKGGIEFQGGIVHKSEGGRFFTFEGDLQVEKRIHRQIYRNDALPVNGTADIDLGSSDYLPQPNDSKVVRATFLASGAYPGAVAGATIEVIKTQYGIVSKQITSWGPGQVLLVQTGQSGWPADRVRLTNNTGSTVQSTLKVRVLLLEAQILE